MLLFKKKFLDAIRSGRKTQTVRLWSVCRMQTGQRSYIPGVGYIWIRAVDEVALDDLTDDDARLDGFDDAQALRAEINALYVKQLAAGYRAYRLRFELAPDEVKKPTPERVKKKREIASTLKEGESNTQSGSGC